MGGPEPHQETPHLAVDGSGPTCVDSPGFAFSLRFLGARPLSVLEPLADLRKNVSLASTIPLTVLVFTPFGFVRKR